MKRIYGWSKEENKVLRKLFPTHTNPEIGKQLGLTRDQVKVQASKLGLKRPAEFASETARRRASGRTYPNRKLKQQPGMVVWRPPAGKTVDHQWYIFTGQRQVVALKRYLWQLHVGQIPATHVIRYRDGNPRRCILANLECVPRGELILGNADREKAAATITEGRAKDSYYAHQLFRRDTEAARLVLTQAPQLIEVYKAQKKLQKYVEQKS